MGENDLAEIMRTAMRRHQAGQLEQAEALYRQVLAQIPNHPEALYFLGVLAYQCDDHDTAVDLIRRAIAIKGEWAEGCFHLGAALQAKEQFERAIGAYRRAIALNPALEQVHYNLGVVLQLAGYRDKAIAAYSQAVALKPDDAYAYVNLGFGLQAAGKINEAIEAQRRAVSLKPDWADAHLNLGLVLRENRELDDAIGEFRQAVALQGSGANAWAQLGSALWEAGQIDQAIAAQEWAVALKPEDADAHWTLSQLLLLKGDFPRGWKEFEWRWQRKFLPWPRRKFSQPLWDGSDLSGRTILLQAEKSNADTIQFIRYLPLVQARGGKIIVECQPGLRRLLEACWSGIERWAAPGEALPSFDVYCPLLSLPLVLGTTLETIPSDLPHWRLPDQWTEKWRGKMNTDGHKLKVGVAWAGSPSQIEDRKRSISLQLLSPLAQTKGVEFYSLQKGHAGHPPAGMLLHDFSGDLTDFADTAALISQLDLIISVDTAVAHLAAAMGKKVWTLLPFVPDWRWMMQGENTPWYSTMKLFRQQACGDWAAVIDRVAEQLNAAPPPRPAGIS